MRKADGNRFRGTCEAGDSFTGKECNTKVIGARPSPRRTSRRLRPGSARFPLPRRRRSRHPCCIHAPLATPASPHQSAVAPSEDFRRCAPAAKLAIYKVAFTSAIDERPAIYTGDALAAIDAAVADGVDVINYSVSGSDTVDDPVDMAFLSAASAGILWPPQQAMEGPK